MLKLSKMKRKDEDGAASRTPKILSTKRIISIRDRLLVKEVQEMHSHLPSSCRLFFPNPNHLEKFQLTVSPEDDSFWRGGNFSFSIEVPEEYNMLPPLVRCETRVWHPNISESGDVCLSLLRPTSIDSLGWAPTRHLKDVVWGLNSLFSDLLNFDDPLNVDAAEEFNNSKDKFRDKCRLYVAKYCSR